MQNTKHRAGKTAAQKRRTAKRIATMLFLAGGIASIGIAFSMLPPPVPLQGQDVVAIVRGNVARNAMNELAYDIARVRAGEHDVPNVFLAALPTDLAEVRIAAQRKDMFVAMILPLVLRENEEITANRVRLMEISERSEGDAKLPADDRLWLAAMAERYDTEPANLAELARRLDIVPPSLALAQAAEESGWGTSRFANEGNALFGQRTYGTDGMAPQGSIQGRIADENFRVRAYRDLGGAVRSYIHNLNTHAAYTQFRKERAKKRAADQSLTGHALAETLMRYSERGTDYVKTLQSLIRANRLNDFDKARLGDKFADNKPI
jgi:Bax protein